MVNTAKVGYLHVGSDFSGPQKCLKQEEVFNMLKLKDKKDNKQDWQLGLQKKKKDLNSTAVFVGSV